MGGRKQIEVCCRAILPSNLILPVDISFGGLQIKPYMLYMY